MFYGESNYFDFHGKTAAFENRIEDDIKQYFGKDTAAFVDDGLKIDRKVELYEHQTVSLQEIRKRRMAGIKAFLIVLPTASGKSRIVEEDLHEFAKEKPKFRGIDTGSKNYYSCRLEGANTGICTRNWKKKLRSEHTAICADIIWNSQRTITIIS